MAEEAFAHLGNHLMSDSTRTIKAGADELSTIDPDENLLYSQDAGSSRRRRTDDDDNQTEVYDDDDNDSLTSVPVERIKGMKLGGQEDKQPAHACA